MKVLFIILALTSSALATDIVLYNTGDNRVTQHIQSMNPAPYEGCTNCIIFHSSESTVIPLRDLVRTIGLRYLKHSSGDIVEMLQSEKDQVDAENQSAALASVRLSADGHVDNLEDIGMIIRAFAFLTMDEINILRQWISDFKTQVSLAVSLADLKVRIATLPDLPDRSKPQIKTGIKNKISSGEAD